MEANGNVSTQSQSPVADGEITTECLGPQFGVTSTSHQSPVTRYWLQCADQTKVVTADNQGCSTFMYVLILCVYLSVLLRSCKKCARN